MKKSDKILSSSMTGFGKGSASNGSVTIEVEIRSVNQRFLDASFKLPRPYLPFEGKLREEVQRKVSRGRVEVFVNRTLSGTSDVHLNFNETLFDAYRALGETMLERHAELDDEKRAQLILNLLQNREIVAFDNRDDSADSEEDVLQDAMQQALRQLCGMRAAEGVKLGNVIRDSIGELRKIVDQINTLSKKSPEQLKEKLMKRVSELSPEVVADSSRIYLEVTLLADRIDITEELTRLYAHLDHFCEAMGASLQGRKLDFLLQETLREFNTMNSKAETPEVQRQIVEGKVLIEKIREQVQNIE